MPDRAARRVLVKMHPGKRGGPILHDGVPQLPTAHLRHPLSSDHRRVELERSRKPVHQRDQVSVLDSRGHLRLVELTQMPIVPQTAASLPPPCAPPRKNFDTETNRIRRFRALGLSESGGRRVLIGEDGPVRTSRALICLPEVGRGEGGHAHSPPGAADIARVRLPSGDAPLSLGRDDRSR